MLKSECRQLMLSKRSALSTSECTKLDDLLLIQFQRLDWSGINCVGSFYPLESKNEPNSLLLTKYLKAMFPNVTIAYPKINEDNSMDFYVETNDLIENKWGIPEPIPTSIIYPEKLEAYLVPLLCFDLLGHRVGFGKGYYDQYFSKHPNFVPKIGISYFEPIPKIEDTNHFDVPLTKCITPWKIYEF